MIIAHIYVSGSEYQNTPTSWQYGQTLSSQAATALSQACQDRPEIKCIVKPFSEIQDKPEVLDFFNISMPPAILIHDNATGNTVRAGLTKESIIEAIDNVNTEGGGGANPFTNGTGFNPFGLINLPAWAWLLIAAILLGNKK